MRITTLTATVLATASVVSADVLTILARAQWTTWTQRSNAIWHFNNGEEHQFSANEGCRGNPVPGVREICMDWSRVRAHFWEGNRKRCFQEWNERTVGSCAPYGESWGTVCSIHRWHEVGCSW
ncbi:hypothetical protein N657DRAFT_442192 [Parathielavia appendiculata]|uniref:Uncharacterized protein n=1 Tax=Parathielavia appendiculata TaxID=2587402 RepID=A0AAN6TP54_9PEZI|nr:hypothetical protein N657DRAFT_442192 [Parathielavia appendiculata]